MRRPSILPILLHRASTNGSRSKAGAHCDSVRRNILATGAAAMAMAASPRLFPQQTRKGVGAMSFYEKGPVRIHYEEAGSGFPLLLIAGGGLNSTIAGLSNPFNSIAEFKGEYRCIAADLRNANPGQSSGPLEIDRPSASGRRCPPSCTTAA